MIYPIFNMQIDLTIEFEKTLNLMENSSQNLFITGKAGTGKSTLLNHFRSISKKNLAILAPTGVAAINVKGQTIHSFFKFKPSITLDTVSRLREQRIYKKIDTLIIDEISMVRSDLLDCVDKAMRLNGRNSSLPFGGVQLIFFGDLYQLPPVVPQDERYIFESYYQSPYFFSSNAFKKINMQTIEMTKVFRQSEQSFIDLLNAVRNDELTLDHMRTINTRLNESFKPQSDQCYIYLTPTNSMASYVNQTMLNRIDQPSFFSDAKIKGRFDRSYFPAPETLELKEGAQIMMVNNDFNGRWINGTMGKILRIKKYPDRLIVSVLLENGKEYDIKPHKWEVSKFVLANNQIAPQILGSFTQFPMMLAWALTIHKSQGKTFKKIILDIGRGAFSPGQVYVALSRCETIDGIVLKAPIDKKDIWVDDRIIQFMEKQ